MRQLLALLLSGLALAACQSSRPLYPTGLYRTAADFRHQRGPGAAGPQGLRANQPRPVPLDSLWGYAEVNHAAYRVYRPRAYEVEQPDTLAIYLVLVSNGKTSHRDYYFSNGLGGPVERLRRRQLRRGYAANPQFLALLHSLRWYQSLAAYDVPSGGTRRFRAVALQALGLPAALRR